MPRVRLQGTWLLLATAIAGAYACGGGEDAVVPSRGGKKGGQSGSAGASRAGAGGKLPSGGAAGTNGVGLGGSAGANGGASGAGAVGGNTQQLTIDPPSATIDIVGTQPQMRTFTASAKNA